MIAVTFVDTSVLCELLEVPGKSSPEGNMAASGEMDRRAAAGERFVIPVTSVIETGNHIAQCVGNRYEVAGRFVRFLRAAIAGQAPWLILESRLGAEFLTSLCDGDSTGQPLQSLAAAKVGAGDVALLVERDQLLSASAFKTAGVWTLDAGLAANAEAPR